MRGKIRFMLRGLTNARYPKLPLRILKGMLIIKIKRGNDFPLLLKPLTRSLFINPSKIKAKCFFVF